MEMNIQKYMAFVKTIEYGSLTKASEMLHYSQSGISRMIHDLEREWKVCLLERNHKGVKLTSDGMRLMPHMKRICAEYEKMQMEIDDLNGLSSGLIRIGTFSSVATHWIPNIIRQFQKEYPNINYELLLGDYTEIEQWINDGMVDCGFLRLPASNDFETTFLEQDRLLAVLPKNHYLASLDVVPLAELVREPFMLLEKGAKAEISNLFERSSLMPDIWFTTWDDYAIMSMVESGLGVSILPELILKRIPYDIAVRELDIPAYRKIGIALRDKKTASLAVKKFMDFLQYR
ncbi:MAG: LysR family transcriptional regulator [Clostridium sp.]|nr:LysR family transcriptional regulator [Clostridium sp.]